MNMQDNIAAFQNLLELYGQNEIALFMYVVILVYGQSDEGSIITEEKRTDSLFRYTSN